MDELKIIKIPNVFEKVSKEIFPFPFRCMIVGRSGCGKTTVLYNLITQKWGIPFHFLLLFSKSIEQDAYKELKRAFNKLEAEEDVEVARFYDDCENLISVDECEPNSLVAFDDCVNSSQQSIIKDFYVKGRHKNISTVYLTQNFTRIDKQLIRSNLNYICIFKQDIQYTKNIYDEFVDSDFTFKEFKAICDSCWKEEHGFLSIDLEKNLNRGKYRKKFGIEIQSHN